MRSKKRCTKFATALAAMLMMVLLPLAAQAAPPADAAPADAAPSEAKPAGQVEAKSKVKAKTKTKAKAKAAAGKDLPRKKAAAKPAVMPFNPGEKLTYDISVMGARAASGTLEVHPERKHNGRKVIPVTGKVKTEAFFDNVYKVKDSIASLLMPVYHAFPVRMEMKSERKNLDKDYTLDFDHRRRRLKGRKIRVRDGKKTDKKLNVRVPPRTQDMLSWIYHLRTVDLTEGRSFKFHSHSGNFLYQVHCEVKGTESIWTRLGHMDAAIVDITVSRVGNKEFKKTAKAWLGTEKDRLPIRIEFSSPVGKTEAMLVSVENGKTDRTTAAR